MINRPLCKYSLLAPQKFSQLFQNHFKTHAHQSSAFIFKLLPEHLIPIKFNSQPKKLEVLSFMFYQCGVANVAVFCPNHNIYNYLTALWCWLWVISIPILSTPMFVLPYVHIIGKCLHFVVTLRVGQHPPSLLSVDPSLCSSKVGLSSHNWVYFAHRSKCILRLDSGGKGVETTISQRRKEGVWRKNARAARLRGPGLEPGTYRVLGEGQ